MKVLVIGANGMAGHVITRYLKQQGHDVSTLARSNADLIMDVENFAEVQRLSEVTNMFDFVINCVGLLVKDSNDRPDRAALINGWFPHFLEHTFLKSKTRVVHLSTDCVFDGKKGNYVESDTHTETNSYGKSKSLGEINNDKDVTFRMSIIGPEIKLTGTGLFQWIMTNPQQELQGWDNAWWNGITTLELAKCIEKYMRNPIITGVYHVVNNENKISKYDLVSKINEVYQLGKTILRTQGPKPVNKILIDTRKLIDFKIPSYDIMLLEMKNFNMYNILLACDSVYYETWAINCAKSIQKFTPWMNVHIVIVNPVSPYYKISGVTYHEDVINFPNESCKIPYYQAVRFLKCAELFSNNELVMTIDCDTLCTKEFTKDELHTIISTIHVQRHQKNIRWMAGLVTYGSDSKFRNEFKEQLLSVPLENWQYGWDQDILNILDNKYHYKKLYVGDWMNFGRLPGTFLTLKGDQKTAEGYLEIYNRILKNV